MFWKNINPDNKTKLKMLFSIKHHLVSVKLSKNVFSVLTHHHNFYNHQVVSKQTMNNFLKINNSLWVSKIISCKREWRCSVTMLMQRWHREMDLLDFKIMDKETIGLKQQLCLYIPVRLVLHRGLWIVQTVCIHQGQLPFAIPT